MLDWQVTVSGFDGQGDEIGAKSNDMINEEKGDGVEAEDEGDEGDGHTASSNRTEMCLVADGR